MREIRLKCPYCSKEGYVPLDGRVGRFINRADHCGLYMKTRRNRVWIWFDRKTGYRLFPKAMILTFLTTAALLGLVVLFIRHNIDMLFSVDLVVVGMVLALIAFGEGIVLLRISGEGSTYRRGTSNEMITITSPFFRHLEGNIWHHDSDNSR